MWWRGIWHLWEHWVFVDDHTLQAVLALVIGLVVLLGAGTFQSSVVGPPVMFPPPKQPKNKKKKRRKRKNTTGKKVVVALGDDGDVEVDDDDADSTSTGISIAESTSSHTFPRTSMLPTIITSRKDTRSTHDDLRVPLSEDVLKWNKKDADLTRKASDHEAQQQQQQHFQSTTVVPMEMTSVTRKV
jgi:hypothetical protein